MSARTIVACDRCAFEAKCSSPFGAIPEDWSEVIVRAGQPFGAQRDTNSVVQLCPGCTGALREWWSLPCKSCERTIAECFKGIRAEQHQGGQCCERCSHLGAQ